MWQLEEIKLAIQIRKEAAYLRTNPLIQANQASGKKIIIGAVVIFATDFPYVPLAGAKPFVDNAHLSDGDKEKFAHLNAETLLHLKD